MLRKCGKVANVTQLYLYFIATHFEWHRVTIRGAISSISGHDQAQEHLDYFPMLSQLCRIPVSLSCSSVAELLFCMLKVPGSIYDMPRHSWETPLSESSENHCLSV